MNSYKDPEYMKKWRARNKDKRKIHNRRYYESHKKQISMREKEKYKRNREKIINRVKKYYRKNPEKVKAKEKKYKERIRYSGNKEIVLQRDNYACRLCGITNQDHFIKYGRGLEIHHIDGNGIMKDQNKKNNNINNLITLCCSCHPKIEWGRKIK